MLTVQAAPPKRALRFRWIRGDHFAGLVIISPTFLYPIALPAVPQLAVVLFSFWTQDYLRIDRTFTFVNYEEA